MRRSPTTRRRLGGDRLVRTTATMPAVLSEAVWWIDAALSTGTQAVANLGTGGSALNAQLGSTTGADTNDPQLLPFAGTPYLYLPGSGNNHSAAPDAAGLDITGDLSLIHVATGIDWSTNASGNHVLIAKSATGQRSYALRRVSGARTIALLLTADGSTVATRTSTAPVPADTNAVAVTLDADNGASGHDVRFFTSTNYGATWVQLGSTVTTAGAYTIHAGTAPLTVGWDPIAGGEVQSIYYASVASGIGAAGVPGGTVVAKFEPGQSAEPHASWTATTGETWTVNRSTSGRKAVLVDRSLWLLGTDDYLEVADNALLDFASGETGTIAVVVRQAATPVSAGTYLAKRTTAAGWALTSSTTEIRPAGILSDGTDTRTGDGSLSSVTAGATHVFSMVRSADNASAVKVDATAMASFGTGTVDDASNSEVMRVGRLSGASTGYQDFTLIAAMVWRRALTNAELDAVYAYYNARRM